MELEKERKRNAKELAALEHTNRTLLSQRDEAQRVVLHLRSLINGQALNLENIVQSIAEESDDVPETMDEDFDDFDQDSRTTAKKTQRFSSQSKAHSRPSSRPGSRSASRASLGSRTFDAEYVNPEMERRFFNSPRESRRFSQLSVVDSADRSIKNKTEAIADIIRNISAQCAAAVEGLQLAHDAENEEQDDSFISTNPPDGKARLTINPPSCEDRDSFLHPGTPSSIPQTPELTHRSSTALSNFSDTRYSLNHASSEVDVPTRIVEDEDDENVANDLHEVVQSSEAVSESSLPGAKLEAKTPHTEKRVSDTSKSIDVLVNRASVRVSAFGANQS